VETIEEKAEKEKVPVSAELADEARKWLEPPPQAVEPEQQKPVPEPRRAVRFDLD
jgi:hypothetical protein